MHGPITEEILARKPWLAGYGARIPADINPDAHGSVLHMFEAAMRLYAERPAFVPAERSATPIRTTCRAISRPSCSAPSASAKAIESP
jgi:hypothetical protein